MSGNTFTFLIRQLFHVLKMIPNSTFLKDMGQWKVLSAHRSVSVISAVLFGCVQLKIAQLQCVLTLQNLQHVRRVVELRTFAILLPTVWVTFFIWRTRASKDVCSNAVPGLSYRKGLSWSRSKDYQEVLCLRPLDLCSALAAVNCTHELDATYVHRTFYPQIVWIAAVMQWIYCLLI